MTTMIAVLIETVIKSSIILCIALFASLLLRRQSAALRHAVWTAGLFSALALPLFSFVLPSWQIEPIRAVRNATIAIAPPAAASAQPAATFPTSRTSAIHPAVPNRITPARVALLLWLLGVVTVGSLLLLEAAKLARVVFGSDTLHQQSWKNLVHEVSEALHLRRPVRLIRNPRASALGTWGTLRPRVLLPRESESWTGERMRVVLGHELAHVKRNDWLVQIVAETARAVYWFNPLFWVVCAQLRRQSEHACDDAAMRLGVDGPTYASHVLDLARTLKHSGQPGSAALAMASTSNLERRLLAMLNPSLNRCVVTKGAVLVVILMALGLTLPLAAMHSPAMPPTTAIVHATELLVQPPAAALVPGPAPVPLVQKAAKRPITLIAVTPVPAAQNGPGAVAGKVHDPTGAMIPGVSITITDESNVRRMVLTNDSGSFSTELAPGMYSMTAALPDFQTVKFSRLQVVSGQSNNLEITMHIAAASTFVDITASLPAGVTSLKCFSVFGNVKADGTPFTDADCPGGTAIVLPPQAPAPPTDDTSQVADSVLLRTSPIAAVEPPAQTSDRRVPIRVGGYVQAGNLIFSPKPPYPAEARNKGIEGSVILAAVIGVDGHLRSLKTISSTNPVFDVPTMETVQQWVYKPTLLNGQPIEIVTTITARYSFNR